MHFIDAIKTNIIRRRRKRGRDAIDRTRELARTHQTGLFFTRSGFLRTTGHLRELLPSALARSQRTPPRHSAHTVCIIPDSDSLLLVSIVGKIVSFICCELLISLNIDSYIKVNSIIENHLILNFDSFFRCEFINCFLRIRFICFSRCEFTINDVLLISIVFLDYQCELYLFLIQF